VSIRKKGGRDNGGRRLIPIAKQLRDLKIEVDSMLPWIETIREKARIENVTMDIAAISVAQEIRNYRNGRLQQTQLSIAQKQREITALTGLLKGCQSGKYTTNRSVENDLVSSKKDVIKTG